MDTRKVGLVNIQAEEEVRTIFKDAAEKAGITLTRYLRQIAEQVKQAEIDTEFQRRLDDQLKTANRDTGRGRPKTSKVDTLNGRTLREDDEYWKAKQAEGMKTNSYAYQREPGYDEWYKRNFGYMHKRLDLMGGFEK